VLKRIASWLPHRLQQELKRLRFRRQILGGVFQTDEPEFNLLPEWIRPGDTVIDVGANIGHYSCRMAVLAGPRGRVIAFEPIPHTFELLAANVALLPTANVTLVNAAASDATAVVGMDLPVFDSGLRNYYRAAITPSQGAAAYYVTALSIDALGLSQPVSLVKIDAEGHELAVLNGMQALLRRSHPRLIVEGPDEAVESFLAGLGYAFEALPGSPNRIYTYRDMPRAPAPSA
jgi:FkbM family methyltransferase